MREIVLDTETTGLNFRGDDRIIEVGCVEVINHVATKNTLQFYCRTGREMSTGAEKISGISNEFLKDKKTFSEQHLILFDFIKDDPLVIHNAEFDLGFLNNELNIIGKEPLRNKMNGMKGMFPMMFTMGIVNGAMMSQMLHMNHMNVIDYFIDQPILIDYLTDPSGEPYTDGSGGDLDGGYDGGEFL